MYPYRTRLEVLAPYLDIYHHKLYSVWPIVHKDRLMDRLRQDITDPNAYILACSVCVATILQLQLAAKSSSHGFLDPKSMLDDIEAARRTQDYRESPTLDTLSASFFLHVAYLHMGCRTTSTLLLREAIGVAHMLELHKPTHYEGMPSWDVQDRLRKLWLLFITER